MAVEDHLQGQLIKEQSIVAVHGSSTFGVAETRSLGLGDIHQVNKADENAETNFEGEVTSSRTNTSLILAPILGRDSQLEEEDACRGLSTHRLV